MYTESCEKKWEGRRREMEGVERTKVKHNHMGIH
jgi:hypothetical protein